MKRMISIGLVCLFLSLAGLPAWAETSAPGAVWAEDTPPLEEAYREYILTRARKLRDLGPFETWPLEERAELYAILIESGYIDIHDANAVYHGMPNAGDMSREDAIRIAEEAIADRYGVVVGHPPDWSVECSFLRTASSAIWDLKFKQKAQVMDFSRDIYWLNVYVANVDSPSGQVHVYQNAQESNSPLIIPWDERPEDQRPRPGDLSEEEAVSIARNAVSGEWLERRGLPEDIFAGFQMTTGIAPGYAWSDQPLGRAWVVQFMSDDNIIHAYFNHVIVILNSETGEVLLIDNESNG